MKNYQIQVVLLFLITFLFLVFYQGFHNYIVYYLIHPYGNRLGEPGKILIMGFRNYKNLSAFVITAALCTFIICYYWNRIFLNKSILYCAIIFSTILGFLFLLYRLLFAAIGGYFNLDPLKRITISALLLVPLYLLIILPILFALKNAIPLTRRSTTEVSQNTGETASIG